MAKTFNDYWAALVNATPQLADEGDTMKMRIAAFKRQLEKAYWQGHENGRAAGRPDSFEDLLKQFTGKK